MPERVVPGPVGDTCGIREAVCIHTKKIYDSCRDKDCIEDLRFFPKLQSLETVSHALSVKGGSAKLLHGRIPPCSARRLSHRAGAVYRSF